MSTPAFTLLLRVLTLGVLAVLTAAPLSARQRAYGWVEQGGSSINTNGVASTEKAQISYPLATVTVTLAGTSTLATLYSDNSGTAKTNPFTADATGYWFFYADNGRYTVTFSGGTIPSAFALADVLLNDADVLVVPSYTRAGLPSGSAGQLVRVSDDGRGLWLHNGTSWAPLNGRVINGLEYGMTGDCSTDDTAAFQAAGNAALASSAGGNVGALYLPGNPTYGCYKISSVTFNGDLVIFGPRGHGGFGNEATISCSNNASDCVIMNGNTWGLRNITFRSWAGWAGSIASVTGTSITFNGSLSGPDYTTIAAEPLIASFTPVTIHTYYTNAGQVYRANASGTAGATLPTHTSGTAPVGGISWTWVAAGTTYTVGQFGWGQQWYFTGNTSNSITGVVPAPGETAFTDPASMVSTLGGVVANVAGGAGYFSSLQHKSSTTRTAALVYAQSGQDPVIKDCWFNGAYGAAIRRNSSTVQGGIWSGNVVDNAQYGLYGDLSHLLFTANRIYGTTHAGIFTTSSVSPHIVGNYFNLNTIGIQLDDGGSYTTPNPLGSSIIDVAVKSNHSNNDVVFLKARGVAHLDVTGNRTYRTYHYPLWFINVSMSHIRDNFFTGAGEGHRETPSTFYSYIVGEGSCGANVFSGNTFDYVNSAQLTQVAINFTNSGWSKFNTFSDNHFVLPAGTAIFSDTAATSFNGAWSRMGGSTRLSAPRTLSTQTLSVNNQEQFLYFTGTLSSKAVLTLDRDVTAGALAYSGARAGDFFLLRVNAALAGLGYEIIQTSSATILYANYSPGTVDEILLATFDGEQWAVRPLAPTGGAKKTSFTLKMENVSGAIKHSILADGSNGGAAVYAGTITGASATATNTPNVSGGATAFSAGAGLDSADVIFDNPFPQTAGNLSGIAVIETNTTTTAYSVEILTRSTNVNGTTRNRLALRLRNATTGSSVAWATALNTNAYQIRVRVYADLQ